MRQVIDGQGLDSTAACAAALASGANITLANLFLIGDPENPFSLWLTDWEAPLLWPAWGTFNPAVIKRGTVTSAIGLQVSSLDVTWSPPAVAYTQNVSTASPYQLAAAGFYDNWKVRVWTVYMPTPGDCITLGASQLFGGRIASSKNGRGQIIWSVNSFLDVVNQDVPTNVIEFTNTQAAYVAASPPKGLSNIPFLITVAGSSPTQVIGDETSPSAHRIYSANAVRDGYLFFGTGSSLSGIWGAIQQNVSVNIGGTNYNQFLLYAPLPWTPAAGDAFYISGTAPIDRSDGDYYGFPFVPDPSLSA